MANEASGDAPIPARGVLIKGKRVSMRAKSGGNSMRRAYQSAGRESGREERDSQRKHRKKKGEKNQKKKNWGGCAGT